MTEIFDLIDSGTYDVYFLWVTLIGCLWLALVRVVQWWQRGDTKNEKFNNVSD